MSSKFISGVLVVATAVAFATANPARAKGLTTEEVIGLTTAAIVFGAIAHKISKDKKRERAKVIVTHPPKQVHKPAPPKVHKPAPKPQKAHRLHSKNHAHRPARLPGQCVRDSYGKKARLVMPTRCLKRHDVRLRALPNKCKTVYLNHKYTKRYGYNVRCLRENGYRMSRR